MREKRRKKTDISRCQGKYPVLQIPRHGSFSAKGYLNAIMKMNKVNLRRGTFPFHQKNGELLRKFVFSVCDGEVLITGCHSKFSLKSIAGFVFIDYDGCGNSSVPDRNWKK